MNNALYISEELISDILWLHGQGRSLQEISQSTGLSKSTCYRVVRGQRNPGHSYRDKKGSAPLSVGQRGALIASLR